MLSTLGWVVRRDLLLAWRRRTDVLTTMFFFVIVSSLFPLGVDPQPALLRAMAPGVLWVAALLASMLSAHHLFAFDHADGTLEQWMLSSEPLPLLVLGKVVAHWLVAGLPLVALAPLLGAQYGLSGSASAVLTASLLLGTPVLGLLGAVGAALTLGVRGGGLLLALLVLPLAMPVLVFGAGAVAAQGEAPGATAALLLLAGLLAAALALAPWASAAALRLAID